MMGFRPPTEGMVSISIPEVACEACGHTNRRVFVLPGEPGLAEGDIVYCNSCLTQYRIVADGLQRVQP